MESLGTARNDIGTSGNKGSCITWLAFPMPVAADARTASGAAGTQQQRSEAVLAGYIQNTLMGNLY